MEDGHAVDATTRQNIALAVSFSKPKSKSDTTDQISWLWYSLCLVSSNLSAISLEFRASGSTAQEVPRIENSSPVTVKRNRS